MSENNDQIQLTEDGGIFKQILRPGVGDGHPQKGASVQVHYVGTLLDGSEFDSSRSRNSPFNFKLGVGQVIKGWDIGVASMKRGELAVLTCLSDYAYGASGSPPKIPGGATLKFEVELLDWNEDEEVTDDGMVVKKVLFTSSSESAVNPNEECRVTISYQAYHSDNILFEEKFHWSFQLGSELSIPGGLEDALRSMARGDKARITIKDPVKYGFGSQGYPALNVPPNARLIYQVELHNFELAPFTFEINAAQKIERANLRKENGNRFFKVGALERARSSYESAVRLMEYERKMSEEEQAKANEVKLLCYANTAAVFLKMNKPDEVIQECNKALAIDAKHAKSLLRRGQAYLVKKDFELAVVDFEAVGQFSPDDKKTAAPLLAQAKQTLRQFREKERQLFSRAFA